MLSIDDLMILGFSFIRLVIRLLRDMKIIAFFYILYYYFLEILIIMLYVILNSFLVLFCLEW